jgi:two-component system, OmpR family, response regulator
MEKKRILIVDDEASFTRTTRFVLEQTGSYEVGEVNDSRSALSTAKSFKPDLILLDVVMPEMDGGDLAAHIQADPFLKDVPIVFLTALMERDENKTGPETRGGFRFLSKMVSKDELIDCIQHCLK